MGLNYIDRGENKDKHYFTDEMNQRCVEELAEWIPRRRKAIEDADGEKPDFSNCPVPEYVGEMILLIVAQTARSANYNRYWFIEECIGETVIECMKYLHTFDVTHVGERSKKVNFYAWVTWAADKTFGHVILAEEHQRYQKSKAYIEFAYNPNSEIDNSDIGRDHQAFIAEYEAKTADRKAKQKAKRDARRLAKNPPKVKSNGLAKFIKGKKKADENS